MNRHYGMDWLRIGAFGLLIFYHVGMFFVHWPWHVKTAQPLDWVAVPMHATSAWRLSLLFVVSGFASAAILSKGHGIGRFVRERSARLLIPLVVAMIIVVPPQPWVELVSYHGYARDYLSFWTSDYFRFGEIDGIAVPTWQHLWFVVYLWFYTLLLAALIAVLPARWRAAIAAFADRALAGSLILVVPIALLWLHLALIWPGHSETHDLVNDGPSHRVYFAAFAFGVLLWNAPRTWEAIRRWWKLAALLAVAAYATVAGVELVYPGKTVPPPWVIGLFGFAKLVQAWAAIVALIGIADLYWNRDHPWRATLVEAVFPFYIIHQTVIVVVGYWIRPLALGPGIEFFILVTATIAGCWAFYLGGRAIPWARPLIGLKRTVAAPGRSATASAPAD